MKYLMIALALTPATLFAASRDVDLDRISASTEVLQDILSAPDRGIPHDILKKAQCVGIFPGVKKAGFIFAGKYGVGVMTCRTANGWSAPASEIIEGGSIGLQIGAGETDVVLVVQNRDGENKLMQDKFTLNASAGAMAGPVGRTASAETDAQLHAEILSYSRSRGLFGGVDLGGATMRPDNSANAKIYGRPVTQREILNGRVTPPPAASELYRELDNYRLNARND